jgi:hypothetical protein
VTDLLAGYRAHRGLNDALKFTVHASRRDKVWSGVPNGFKKGKDDLLISYLEIETVNGAPSSIFTECRASREARGLRRKSGQYTQIRLLIGTVVQLTHEAFNPPKP